jgi:hypothetical protein
MPLLVATRHCKQIILVIDQRTVITHVSRIDSLLQCHFRLLTSNSICALSYVCGKPRVWLYYR